MEPRRYDIVALVALLVVAFAGLVPPNQVLAGLISSSEIYKSIDMSVIQFGDYWRMGLPLSVLVVATAVPAILWIWPL